MQPIGRKKVRFPSKTKEWFGKGILMWWENITKVNKKTDRRVVKKDIYDNMGDT